MYEHFLSCPYCNAPISMLLDSSIPSQAYIEDCEVCCRPIEIGFQFSGMDLCSFEAHALEQ